MLQMTVGKLKAEFSQVLEEIKMGNDVEILYGRSKKPVALLTNLDAKKKPKKRKLGTLKGTFTEVDDGKITLEEFFGVNSLDEVKPLIV